MTQEQWNDKQRSKREKEFAPPSTYVIDPTSESAEASSLLYFTSVRPKKRKSMPYKAKKDKRVPINFEYSADTEVPNSAPETQPQRKGTEIPPPSSYEMSNSASAKPAKSNISVAIEAGLNFLKDEAQKKSVKKDNPY